MLTKLLKYDLKYIYKQLIVFYTIVLFFAILARLTNIETNSFILKFVHEFSQGCTFGFSFGMFINASMRTWYRLRANFYGDESYLTHTLPVPRHTLWLSKFLSSIIVVFTSAIVFIVAFLIMFFSEEFIHDWNFTDSRMITFYIIFIIAVFLQVTFIIQAGFTGIIIGYHRNDNRTVRSVIWGLVTYFSGLLILIGTTLLWSLFNETVYNAIFHGIMSGDEILQLLAGFSVIYAILITITYFINNRLLARGVNVD